MFRDISIIKNENFMNKSEQKTGEKWTMIVLTKISQASGMTTCRDATFDRTKMCSVRVVQASNRPAPFLFRRKVPLPAVRAPSNPVSPGRKRDGDFKLIRSPGIDSKESILPAYIA
jgi:hypothetical protein